MSDVPPGRRLLECSRRENLVIPTRVKVVEVMVSELAVAAGLLTLSLLSKPAQAEADTETFNDRVPITGTLFNPCTGEFLSYEGTQYIVFHRTEDANGGFHFKGHTYDASPLLLPECFWSTT
jgi:hypothetical protein